MLYVLIVINAVHDPLYFKVYKDLDVCLDKKEIAVEHKLDAHCIRWDEPATVVKDLAPNTTK